MNYSKLINLFFLYLSLGRFVCSIGSGTSHEGSGMLGVFKGTMQRRIITHSIDVIKQLQQDGHDVGETRIFVIFKY